MDTDTSASPEPGSGSLTVHEAGAAFAALLDPPKEETPEPQAAEDKGTPEPETPPEEPSEEEPAEPSAQESDEVVTVEIDGKPVQLTKAQIAEAHKGALRQADYTQKTQALAEQRKAAEAEMEKTRAERQKYAENLQRNAALLEATLIEQQKIDWAGLLESDPVEYLKQQHLYQQRQAALQQSTQELNNVRTQEQAEHQTRFREHLMDQREQLLAKIPEWKDEAKQKAGVAEIKDYLLKAGYSESEIANVHDHRAVINVRKAMLYDRMVEKAKAATKIVQKVPQRVERTAGGDAPSLDRRQAAFQRLSKSGRVEDAGAVFSNLFS